MPNRSCEEYGGNYPSKALRDWCRNIQKLVANNNLNTGFTNYNDGFCLCDMDKVINLAPVDQQSQLASGIFWSVWIDQVLYYVLVDGGVEGFERDPKLYQSFRNIYKLPKLHEHFISAHASPSFLLDGNRKYPVPNRMLLLEDKREFWGEISCWLKAIERTDVKDAAERAFKEDLHIRFPEDFDYLF